MTLENRKTKHMSKLLKEAIADAKAVRETALANARLALEEAFAPRLQSMLTKKLREEEAELDGVEVKLKFLMKSKKVHTTETTKQKLKNHPLKMKLKRVHTLKMTKSRTKMLT